MWLDICLCRCSSQQFWIGYGRGVNGARSPRLNRHLWRELIWKEGAMRTWHGAQHGLVAYVMMIVRNTRVCVY